MPKPALKSQTVRWNLGTIIIGLGTSAIGFVLLPANINKLKETAKIWGVNAEIIQFAVGIVGLGTTLTGGKGIQGRHKVEGPDAIYTPDWLHIGRNLSDLGKSVGIGDVFQAINETKQIAQAKTGPEQFNELVDAVTKLKETVDDRLGKIERSQPILDNRDLAELPNRPPDFVLKQLARENSGPNAVMYHTRKDNPPPQLEMEPVEINNDVIGADDGTLPQFNPEDVI